MIMLNLVYWFLGFITWTAFLWFFIFWIITFFAWCNTKYWISYEAKKHKLIRDQIEDIFGWHFIGFDNEHKVLILKKDVLKDWWIFILKSWLENIKNLYFPTSVISCFETNENILVIFSFKIKWVDLELIL